MVALTCKSTVKGGVCDVYLVGTCHISAKSCREVEAVIRHLKPEVVFLELCSRRVAALTPPNLKDLKELTMEEMIEMWKKNHNTLEIYGWILSKACFHILQSYFTIGLSELEVFPGSEFGVAYEEARKYGGKVILGDRPVQITVGRTRAMMPLWHKIKLLYSLLFSSDDALSIPLEKMDDDDVMIFVQEMGKKYPTLVETFVHERDQYMSSKLLKIASKHRSVVAVVGKGHLQGIKKHWQQPVVLEDLMVIPSKKPGSSTRRILKSMGVAVTAAAIVSGIYFASKSK
ncbi:uncharacterized protein [Pyrus communis]|uniref:uncharacterized protein n=1 Tax=Pyrus communis TaxID=23211 RepID=UPI0035BF499F